MKKATFVAWDVYYFPLARSGMAILPISQAEATVHLGPIFLSHPHTAPVVGSYGSSFIMQSDPSLHSWCHFPIAWFLQSILTLSHTGGMLSGWSFKRSARLTSHLQWKVGSAPSSHLPTALCIKCCCWLAFKALCNMSLGLQWWLSGKKTRLPM